MNTGINNANSYADIYNTLNAMRRSLKESEEGATAQATPMQEEGSIPYTQQDQMMASITDTCKQQFGADFSNIKNPMLYHPKDGDITLSGEIPTMNDAKFQFRYKDSSGQGCYLWSSPVQLTDESLKTLSIMHGVFKNWKKELSTSADIKPMSYKQSEAMNEGKRTSDRRVFRLRRGDDII